MTASGSRLAAAILCGLLARAAPAAPAAASAKDDAVRLNNEGVALLGRGDRMAAVARFAAAQRILPSDPTVARNLAAACIEQARTRTVEGELDDAVHWLDRAAAAGGKATAIRDALAAGYNDAALAFMRRGRYGDAIQLLGGATGLMPSSAALRANLAAALYGDNRREEALVEFRRVLERDPDNAAARRMCGLILYWKGETRDALAELRSALRLNPADAEAASLVKKIEREFELEKDFAVDQHADFTVSFDGARDDRGARAVLEALEEARRRIGSGLSFYPREKIAVVIYTGRQFRDLLDKRKGVGGLYDGKIRVPVGGLDTERDRERLRRVVAHEYAHAAVHFLTHNRCPVWLNEGIAEHLSGDGGGGGERLLRGALERGAIIPLAGLSAAIVETSSPRAALAYAEALSVVSTIAERSGAYTLRRILDFIDAGDGVDAALRKAIALDLAGLEESWLEALRDRYGIRS